MVGSVQEDFQTVLRAAGETETTQENIQDWLQLDEGNPGFQLLTEEEISAMILFIFISTASKTKLHRFRSQSNYTEPATAACC
jgi:hypothetical protein